MQDEQLSAATLREPPITRIGVAAAIRIVK